MLRLVEVRVPALGELLLIAVRVHVGDLLLRRVVIEDLLGLFLSGNHAFDFIENVLVDVRESWPLVGLLSLSSVPSTAAFFLHALSLLDEGLGVHFVEDG